MLSAVLRGCQKAGCQRRSVALGAGNHDELVILPTTFVGISGAGLNWIYLAFPRQLLYSGFSASPGEIDCTNIYPYVFGFQTPCMPHLWFHTGVMHIRTKYTTRYKPLSPSAPCQACGGMLTAYTRIYICDPTRLSPSPDVNNLSEYEPFYASHQETLRWEFSKSSIANQVYHTLCGCQTNEPE